MQNGKMELLENLDPKTLAWLLETAAHARRLVDVMEPLKENGIEVSLATLRRFLWAYKEKQLMEDGEEMKGSAETLVKRGLGEVFRKGTLEAIRQRFYEQAMLSVGAEETQKLFGELLKEEAKWKEIELAERKMALAEESARLQRLRLKLELKAKRKKVEIESAVVEAPQIAGQLTTGTKDLTEEKAMELAREVAGILNRGGEVAGKFLEARDRINEGIREIESEARRGDG